MERKSLYLCSRKKKQTIITNKLKLKDYVKEIPLHSMWLYS